MTNDTMKLRARTLGIAPGVYDCGACNAITDVSGVAVGHYSFLGPRGERTGATAVLPHQGDPYLSRVPTGLYVGNGHGKLMGSTQLEALGELETPLILTNTLAVPEAAAALIDWTIERSNYADLRSINPVVGETNDSSLNNIRDRPLTRAMMLCALAAADVGAVVEGCVGAGSGTTCCGWRAGIGTSSRKLPPQLGGYHVGCLVQPNFDGYLRLNGARIDQLLAIDEDRLRPRQAIDGSIMIILATDAPLSDRNLKRLAFRAICGLAATGSAMANNSGDYAIAFSTAPEVRRVAFSEAPMQVTELPNGSMSGLFQAAIEVTEEAIWNGLLMSEDGIVPEGLPGAGATIRALPVGRLRQILAAMPIAADMIR